MKFQKKNKSKKIHDNDIESELIQHKLKNELETFNIVDTIKLNIKTEFYLSDNENSSNSVFIVFRQSKQEYNLFELKNKLPNNDLSVQNICEYFNEKIIGVCFKLNKKMFDNKTELTKEYLLKVHRTSISELNKEVKSFQINKIHYNYRFISLKFEIINNRYNSCLMYFDDLKSIIDLELKNN